MLFCSLLGVWGNLFSFEWGVEVFINFLVWVKRVILFLKDICYVFYLLVMWFNKILWLGSYDLFVLKYLFWLDYDVWMKELLCLIVIVLLCVELFIWVCLNWFILLRVRECLFLLLVVWFIICRFFCKICVDFWSLFLLIIVVLCSWWVYMLYLIIFLMLCLMILILCGGILVWRRWLLLVILVMVIWCWNMLSVICSMYFMWWWLLLVWVIVLSIKWWWSSIGRN